MPALSVIICTHNPRPEYLRRVLDALKAQTLPKERWELLLIDNASKESLASAWDLSWHPQARHIREGELGLTHARLRGIKESQGELLVFVDDDNVLAVDYLGVACDVMLSHSWLGTVGGNSIGEFETPPESWAEPFFQNLALVEVKNMVWACFPGTKIVGDFAPCGAGMVIRKTIAVYYAEIAAKDPLRRGLGRKGASLASAEDSDMALCACAMGLGVGRFPQLLLTHLMPSARLEQNYLLRLREEMAFSHAILQFIWDGCLPKRPEEKAEEKPMEKPCRSERLLRSYQAMRNRLRGIKPPPPVKPSLQDEFKSATDRGILRAYEILQSQQNGSTEVSDQEKATNAT